MQDINIFVLSDLHFGHHINKTKRLSVVAYQFLDTYKDYLDKSDMVIISGDVYDRLLSSNSVDYEETIKFLTYLVKLCSKNSIKLRILEGTPSHDMKQVKVLYKIIQELNIDIDFKYVEELSIETLEDLGIDILYLPDEWKPTPEETWKDITNLLKKHNKDKVDIVVMHGGFKYQIPMLADHMHDEEKYVNLTYGGPIISGHIHERSMYKNIIIPGSLDRLTFNDEDSERGGLFITYNKDEHQFRFKYLNNKLALIFKTYDLTKMTLKDIIKELKKIKANEAHIRLLVEKEDQMLDSLLELEDMFPNFKFKLKTIKRDTDIKDDNILQLTKRTDTKQKLTRDTMLSYIKEKVTDVEKLNIMLDEFKNISNSI